ncbi:TPA: hypothetical protein DEB00_03575 [Candidatus Uhrbacteria bacterium]|nr:hypothetical protein [Candidatus Uhrbacteria bacterium]
MKTTEFATVKQLSALSHRVQSQNDRISEMQETFVFIKEHMATKEDIQQLQAEIHSEFATKQELAKTKYDILDHIDRTCASKEDLLQVKTDVSQVKADVLQVKDDILEVKADLHDVKDDVLQVKEDLRHVKDDVLQVKNDILEVKNDVLQVKKDLHNVKDDVLKTRNDLTIVIQETSSQLQASIDRLFHQNR